MRIFALLRCLFAISALIFFTQVVQAESRTAYVLEIRGAIGPAVADYVVRGLAAAQDAKATVVVLQMDTPGGLSESMREIDKAILASTVPVVTYVAPSGARAASAGTYILYASHFAVMAPGTNLGAATPVAMGSKDNAESAMLQKATNDATAYIRSLAQLRGRNVEWAVQAVVKAESLSAKEALDKNVINFMADNLPALLTDLNGRQTDIAGKPVTLQTDKLVIKTLKPDWRSRFLSVITDPSVAYLLILVGFYGLILEFTNPGVVIPGVLGTIALLIGLYAIQLLPINYVGLALIFLGLGFLVSEIFVTTHGVLGIGGIIAFVIGSVMLLDTDTVGFGIPLSLILTVTAVSVAFIALIMQFAMRSRRLLPVTGREEILVSTGVVVAIHGKRYQVRIKGELWQAESSSHLRVGQRVAVREMDGLILKVEPHTEIKGE
ncbi:MAG: nodulation protein NfeD [Pseudomonadota bacterium]|nr:nodulation protein NfeD [Pseudomonadota bacterium]